MAIPDNRFSYLYRQYVEKKCSAEEMREFLMLVEDPSYRETLERMADGHLESIRKTAGLPDIDWESMYRNIVRGAATFSGAEPVIGNRKKDSVVRLFTLWRVAAAVIIVLLCVGGYFLFGKRQKESAAAGNVAVSSKNDVPPGGNKAVLTLANGSTITLDSTGNGLVAQQGNARVLKTNSGQLTYNSADEQPAKVLYNTLATPRGGQYQLILPDGSKVWLNAASSLRFPTVFTGKERKVEITGEAYFEIAPNAAMPFIVTKGDVSIAVLGTHFNVNAYDDEAAIKTTLLEGSVSVSRLSSPVSRILKPGQQAQLSAQSNSIRVEENVNTEAVIAWKKGLFNFEDDNITDIMRQLSRWYDINTDYAGQVSGLRYSGIIQRQVNISKVLDMLELAGGAHFTIEGKKIMVKADTNK